MLNRMVLLAVILAAISPVGAFANCEPATEAGSGIPMDKDTGVKIGEQAPNGQSSSGGIVTPPAAQAGSTNPNAPAGANGGNNPDPAAANGGQNPQGTNTNSGGTLTTKPATPPTVNGGERTTGPAGEQIIKNGTVTINAPGPSTTIQGGNTQPAGGGQGIAGGTTTNIGNSPITIVGGTTSIATDGTVTSSGGTITFSGGTNLSGEPVALGPNGQPANALTFTPPPPNPGVNIQFGQ